MIIHPSPLGSRTLPQEMLAEDRRESRKFGPCGVGKEAVYLGTRYIDRCFYLPWNDVERVFKRVAMSKGGFTGRGIFGTLTYLVVQFDNGKEKQSRIRHEADADRMLALIELEHPNIPTHSAAADKKIAAAKAAEEARYLKTLEPSAEEAVRELRKAQAFLGAHEADSEKLTLAAKQKRVVDNFKPGYKIAGTAAAVIGILVFLFGIYALIRQWTAATYCLLGGAALVLFFWSVGMVPNKWNSKKYADSEWENAVSGMRGLLEGQPGFPVPAQYAHPVVLERMIRVLREGKAKTVRQALEVMKEELKALNSSVTVSQEEHDEVVKIKPLFLVCDYRDEI